MWHVYIDYNDDKDFLDEGELVYASEFPSFDPQLPDDGSTMASFRVPDDMQGEVRMRVVMKLVAVFDLALPTSCGVYGAGETEDYTISFFDCSAPQNISGRIFGDDIIVSWDPVLSATEYQIRYTENGHWKTAICPGTSFTLADAPMGSYIFEVRARCGDGLSMASKQVNISMGGIGASGHRITEIAANTTTSNLGILQLFPNPTSTAINVSYQATSEQVVLEVKDILGRTVYQRQEKTASNQVTNMDVSHLSNGIYYLSVYDGAQLITQKFVKE